MFNNVALDVFIGLIAIFLLYSLLASILMEATAKYLGLRQRITLKAHSKLLDDSNFTNDGVFRRLFKSGSVNRFLHNLKDRPLTALFYAHPNIKNLGSTNFNRKPSSISPEMFSDTLIQILRGDNFSGQQNQIDLIKQNIKLNDPDTKNQGSLKLPEWYITDSDYKPLAAGTDPLQINKLTLYQLKQFIYDAHADVDLLKKKLITWHNEIMDRAEGWYIKQTRYILFVIGFILAISFNVNTISIAGRLATDKTARDKMIEFASKLEKDQAGDTLNNKTDGASNAALKAAFAKANNNIHDAQKILGDMPVLTPFWKSLPGWLLTAFALSLGASFWFDLLGKIMCIRQGGNSSATDAQKKSDKSSNSTTEIVG